MNNLMVIVLKKSYHNLQNFKFRCVSRRLHATIRSDFAVIDEVQKFGTSQQRSKRSSA